MQKKILRTVHCTVQTQINACSSYCSTVVHCVVQCTVIGHGTYRPLSDMANSLDKNDILMVLIIIIGGGSALLPLQRPGQTLMI